MNCVGGGRRGGVRRVNCVGGVRRVNGAGGVGERIVLEV